MDSTEVNAIKKSLAELMDGKWEEPIERLCALVGWRYPAAEVAKTAKLVDIKDLPKSNVEFGELDTEDGSD